MRLWLDEMMPAAVAGELRTGGHDVQAVQDPDQRWAQGLEDAEQLAAAVSQGRAIVTFNLRDFVPLSQQWAESKREHLGIILIHTTTIPPDDMGGLVRRLAILLHAHPEPDALKNRVMFLEATTNP